MMRCNALGVCCLLVSVSLLWADDKPSKKELTPAQETRKLIDDFKLDQEEFDKLWRQAKTDAEREKLRGKMPNRDKVMGRLLELAEANPKDKGVVPGALVWVVRQAVFEYPKDEHREQALDLLLGYVHNPQVVEAFQFLQDRPSPSAERLLREVEEKGPTPEIKGKATHALARYLKDAAEKARALKEEPAYAGMYSKGVAQYLQKSDPDAMTNEAEKLFAAAIRKYAGARTLANEPIGERAEIELFELRNLAIGKTAPQIEGVDLDGKKFKLTEYRGKVVLLDFWGNWSGPCRDMYPQERELVKRLADKPFVLLGINSDTKAPELRRAMEKEQISWRSWWNGPEGTNGPLSKKWNVQTWPTSYLLDAKGVIRFKNLRGDKLDKAVDRLIKELD